MDKVNVSHADLALKVALLVHALTGVMEVFATCQVEDPEAELAPVYELAMEIQEEVSR